jgi:hypothetical protein
MEKAQLALQKTLDFDPNDRVIKSSVQHEILDENAKKQDM